MLPIHIRLEAPPVYFLHLPKTAGLSLRLLFESVYAPSDILSLHHTQALNRTTLAQMPHYRCYLCHFGVGLYELVGRTDLHLITMLRDPIERAASHYYYHQNNIRVGRDYLDEPTLRRLRPLVQGDPITWRDTPELATVVCDVQARELGILYDWRPFLKPAAAGQASHHQPLQRHLVPVGMGEVDMAQVTEAAHQRLDEMAVVGITERFDESVEMSCGLLGVPKPARLPRANLGPTNSNVDLYRYHMQESLEFLEQIRALTTYDQELYAHACERFEQQWARFRAARHRTYSIAPRLRFPMRRGAQWTWRAFSSLLPGPDRAPWLHRWKAWLEQRL